MRDKRIVLKKGKFITTRKGSFVLRLSKELLQKLNPLCHKIKIVGSIRRVEPDPVDIDYVIVTKDKEKIEATLAKIGKRLSGGEKHIQYKIEGVKIDIYFSEPKEWGAMLLTYTGPWQYNVGLRTLAKNKGLLLNQYGIYKNKTKLAGKTEKDIYKSLGKDYKKPEDRGD